MTNLRESMSQHPRSNLPSKAAWRNFTYFAKIPQSARWPCMAYSPDGTRLAVQLGHNLAGAIKIVDALTGREIVSHQGSGAILDYSPDGKRLAISRNIGSGSGVGEVVVRDSQTGDELLNLKGHSAGVQSIIFSPDGKRLVSGSGNPAGRQNGELKLWDMETGHELLTIKGGPVRGLAFDPAGNQLVVLERSTVKIYDATPLPEKP